MHAPASGRRAARSGSVPGAISGQHGARGSTWSPSPARPRRSRKERPAHVETADGRRHHRRDPGGGRGGPGRCVVPHPRQARRSPRGSTCDTLDHQRRAECEPYLTTDHRVMLEQRRRPVRPAIRYLLQASPAPRERSSAWRPTSPTPSTAPACEGLPAELPALGGGRLQVKYPQGAEKMLIKALLGRGDPLPRGLPHGRARAGHGQRGHHVPRSAASCPTDAGSRSA